MDGTDLETGATILALVDGTPGANDMPTALVFKTTADGADSSTERMRIHPDGTVNVVDNLTLNSDASRIDFGINADISLIHYHNAGLTLKNNLTSDDTPPHLILSNGETAIEDGDFLGTIQFDAPDESSGTDAILISAAIDAIAEADFSASVNKTKLTFRTATSGVATTKLSLLNDGRGLSPFTARAWARINQTSTQAITSSHNCSGITDNGTGDSTVAFTNAIGSTEYCVLTGNAAETDWGERANPTTTATGSVRIQNVQEDGTFYDSSRVHFMVMYTGV